MSIYFSGSELINVAIGIERKGIAFYDIMARSTENAATRETFQHLVEMERQHIQIFQGILSEVDNYQPPETYAGEYAAYLQALVDSAVFTEDMVNSEMVTQTDSDVKALELAIGAEKDSILFYYGMRDMMAKLAHTTINKIIAEEKLHLRQLSELKKKLSAI